MLLDYILVGTSLLAVTSGLHNDGITAMHRTRTGLRDFVFAGSKSGGIYYRVENRTDNGTKYFDHHPTMITLRMPVVERRTADTRFIQLLPLRRTGIIMRRI